MLLVGISGGFDSRRLLVLPKKLCSFGAAGKRMI